MFSRRLVAVLRRWILCCCKSIEQIFVRWFNEQEEWAESRIMNIHFIPTFLQVTCSLLLYISQVISGVWRSRREEFMKLLLIINTHIQILFLHLLERKSTVILDEDSFYASSCNFPIYHRKFTKISNYNYSIFEEAKFEILWLRKPIFVKSFLQNRMQI